MLLAEQTRQRSSEPRSNGIFTASDIVKEQVAERNQLAEAMKVFGARTRTAAEVLRADPDVTRSPEAVVPHVCFKGRTTLLVAREKVGKSTFATALGAAVTKGAEFLDGSCVEGVVLWLLMEEAEGDLIRRLMEFGADPHKVVIADQVTDPDESYAEMIRNIRPALVVVDTLTDYAALHEHHPQSGDSAGWIQIMRALRNPARATSTSVLILHHQSKKGGARDSTAIAGACDLVLEMRESKEARAVKSKGRWPTEDFEVLLDGKTYKIRYPDAPVADQITRFLRAEGPSSKSAIRRGVSARNQTIDETLAELVQAGTVGEIPNGQYTLFALAEKLS